MIRWKAYPENKPSKSGYCVVKNNCVNQEYYITFYTNSRDHFELYDGASSMSYPIKVDAFIELDDSEK